jgi:tRNA 2-thiocytidine biosynthesis protein TtcA
MDQDQNTLTFDKLVKRLRKAVWTTLDDYHLIEDGDKVMVCLSGGKDSYTMLDILLHIQQTKKYNFEIIAVNLDQKQPGFPEHVLPEYLQKMGVSYQIVQKDTYSIVKEKTPEGKTTCTLCSRLRRGILYKTASELGVTKIALGHHRDDIIETLFLNMMFSGKIETMPAKYRTDNGEHVVIRPLAFCKEKDIEEYSKAMQFPIIPCNLCGSQPNLQRNAIKQMLRNWEEKHPGRSEVIFHAIQNVSPSHLLDKNLYDFEQLLMKGEKDNAMESYVD